MSHRLCCPLQSNILFWSGCGSLAWERRPDDAAVLVKLHAQREAHLHQYIFDLVERFAAEVLGLQHFIFALLYELANGLDISVLQAVVGTHGKLELFNGAVQGLEARTGRGGPRRFDGSPRLLQA